MNEMPPDPIGPVADSAAQIHEMYLSFITAGFSSEQAFELVKVFIMRPPQ